MADEKIEAAMGGLYAAAKQAIAELSNLVGNVRDNTAAADEAIETALVILDRAVQKADLYWGRDHG